MNDQTIQIIAQAVIANTAVIQSLIDALPQASRRAVAEVVAPTAPAPAPTPAPAPAPTPAPAPAPVEVATPPAPKMPPPPVFEAPAPAVAPALLKAPFSNMAGLIEYTTKVYHAIGKDKALGIQKVLESLGCTTINEVSSDKYDEFFTALEKLKA